MPADAALHPDAQHAGLGGDPGVHDAAAPTGVPVGAHVGYAFRSTAGFAVADARNHGVAADVVVDSPPLFAGFGVRGSALALAWPGTESEPGTGAALDPLLFTAGGAALTYRFDDTAVAALVAVGAHVGVVVEGAAADVAVAPDISLTLRFPLTPAATLDGRLFVPFVQHPQFSLAAAAFVGVSIAPDVLVDAALHGSSPASLLLP